MELPITKPSQFSYADEIDFEKLFQKLYDKKYNGFIRITEGSKEGYILFKDGLLVAASFQDYLKKEALEHTMKSLKNNNTLVEVFDLKISQMDYLLGVNKIYKFDPISPIKELVEDDSGLEIKTSKTEKDDYEKELVEDDSGLEIKTEKDNNQIKVPIKDSETNDSPSKEDLYKDETPQVNDKVDNKSLDVDEDGSDAISADFESALDSDEVEGGLDSDEVESKNNSESETQHFKTFYDAYATETERQEENELEEPSYSKNELKTSAEDDVSIEDTLVGGSKVTEDDLVSDKPQSSKDLNRSEIMQKYGLKDIEDEEVEKVLETYKGGKIEIENLEKIEITLMNKIKRSIIGIPKIGKAEVMVFLEYSLELKGQINIVCEYESKSFFSKITGTSKDMKTLKYHILEIAKMEIRKTFRDYPEIVDNFEINIDIA